ncbi:DinB family protein [Pedobacter frigoris]|uniref:DinB family protein n=1 Tax=Pedobacter frigoris TaxID=2571272 RepID=UPI00292F7657|nr:DinB family protein [Pedobacter frigoris]
MEQLLAIIRQTRKNFTQLIEASSLEELNEVPAGFNNNMIWNFGHIIVSQQLLCYKLAGIEPKIDKALISDYQKGTKPERFIEQAEIETLKNLMVSTIDVLETDLKNNIFTSYHGFMTSYGVQLNNTNDAFQFFPVHDAFHYGCASSIKKAINNNR